MATDGKIVEPAPAKINLTLHVTGQREDGYHLLESLVMFTQVGDLITVEPADRLTLTIDGPFGAGLSASDDNLVLSAARLFSGTKGAAIRLTKNLPVASGIGGGSADAAATLRALAKLWAEPLPDATALLGLGADVPVCMTAELTRMEGIGDQVQTLGPAPAMDMVLVNPRISVSTPAVFKRLHRKDNPPMEPNMPDPSRTEDWLGWLGRQHNHLETPARDIASVIDDVLMALNAQRGCRLARMSGSGATCFAIFDTETNRKAAARALSDTYKEWWIAETGAAAI